VAGPSTPTNSLTGWGLALTNQPEDHEPSRPRRTAADPLFECCLVRGSAGSTSGIISSTALPGEA